MAARPEQPYCIARLSDESGSRAELRVHLDRSASSAAAKSAAAALLFLADAASDAVAVEWLLRYPVRWIGEPGAIPGARVELVGLLIFSTFTTNQFALVEIPGVSPALVDPGKPTELNLSAPPLAALIYQILNLGFVNPFGYQLVDCIGGLVQYRR